MSTVNVDGAGWIGTRRDEPGPTGTGRDIVFACLVHQGASPPWAYAACSQPTLCAPHAASTGYGSQSVCGTDGGVFSPVSTKALRRFIG